MGFVLMLRFPTIGASRHLCVGACKWPLYNTILARDDVPVPHRFRFPTDPSRILGSLCDQCVD